METVTLGVASREAVNNRFLNAFEGTEQASHITFESVELLFRILTQRCWNIIGSITGTGPVSILRLHDASGATFKQLIGMCVRCPTLASWS